MTIVILIKMKLYETKTVHFNPPLIDVGEIQLLEYYSQFRKFALFCDIIDSTHSLSNFETGGDTGSMKPTKLLAIFTPSRLFPILPIQNKKELSNITLWLRNEDMKPFYKSDDKKKDVNEDVLISLKIYSGGKNE